MTPFPVSLETRVVMSWVVIFATRYMICIDGAVLVFVYVYRHVRQRLQQLEKDDHELDVDVILVIFVFWRCSFVLWTWRNFGDEIL